MCNGLFSRDSSWETLSEQVGIVAFGDVGEAPNGHHGINRISSSQSGRVITVNSLDTADQIDLPRGLAIEFTIIVGCRVRTMMGGEQRVV